MSQILRRLPAEPVDRLTRPFAHFLRIEAAAGGILALFVLLAVAIANSPWSASYLSFWEVPVGVQIGTLGFSRSLQQWIKEGLITVFFFVLALELKREVSVGELRKPRMATDTAFPASLLKSAKLGILGVSVFAGSCGRAPLARLSRCGSTGRGMKVVTGDGQVGVV